jgi:hypothetical protein
LRTLARAFIRFGLASWLGALHAACGVYMGEPLRLFPDRSARDGGADVEACLQVRTRMSGTAETIVGATGAELSQLTSTPYSAELRWSDGRASRVKLSFSNAVVYSVESRRNPAYVAPHGVTPCRDHATLEASLDLATEDGALDEHVELVRMFAYDGYEAHGSFTLDKEVLQGSYAGHGRAGQCFEQLTVRLMIAGDGSHGTFGDQLSHKSCEEDREAPETEYAAGQWGTRWVNYGD